MADLKDDPKNYGEFVVIEPKRFAITPKTPKTPNLLTAKLLSKFNTPELMQRRATAIAETNAGHTRKSDDALESILTEFEKLSF